MTSSTTTHPLCGAGQNFQTLLITCMCMTYKIQQKKILNENKRWWMEQKTTVKHDNVISNQRKAESKENQIYPSSDSKIVMVMATLTVETYHCKAKLNLLCLILPCSMGYWFGFIRDKKKENNSRQLIRLTWLSCRFCDGISKHSLRPDGGINIWASR